MLLYNDEMGLILQLTMWHIWFATVRVCVCGWGVEFRYLNSAESALQYCGQYICTICVRGTHPTLLPPSPGDITATATQTDLRSQSYPRLEKARGFNFKYKVLPNSDPFTMNQKYAARQRCAGRRLLPSLMLDPVWRALSPIILIMWGHCSHRIYFGGLGHTVMRWHCTVVKN